MTSWRASGSSEGPVPSSAFERLHSQVQRWVWRRGWTSLHPVQEASVAAILDGDRDLLISAPTAGGKTEAAFLPLASRQARQGATSAGVGCLCISPLKALINDQFERLEELFSAVGSCAHRWHGDVPASHKKEVLEGAGGVLLITPESLEGLFVRRGGLLPALFADLESVVVDELHAFPGSARGRQLQSLMHRVETLVRRRLQRIALSATLGDLPRAAEFLRPGGGPEVLVIQDDHEGRGLKLQLRGYVRKHYDVDGENDSDAGLEPTDPSEAGEGEGVRAAWRIAEDLYRHLRGTDNLAFANSRARVEELADRLRRHCERHRVPNEFFPHHGSLSREIREAAEKRLKEEGRPASLICTSTLELGIDVGHVVSIAQVGRSHSVSALRQRLGRSGRRGQDASVLRIYVSEPEITAQSALEDGLRPELVESVAVVELMLDRWIEPPPAGELHLSTLVQQILSVVAEKGGARPQEVWRLLCRDGPFREVDARRFAELLRALGQRDVIQQASDGDLVLGVRGEPIVDHYTFFAAFRTPEELVLRHAGRPLGTLPTSHPVAVGKLLIFAGRRWRIVGFDPEARVVDLVPASGGALPVFGPGHLRVHHKIRRRMRRLYREDVVPRYLDRGAAELLAQGRATYRELELDSKVLVPDGREVLWFPWIGDKALNTLALHLQSVGFEATSQGLTVRLQDTTPDRLRSDLRLLVLDGPPDPLRLAALVENRNEEKYDHLLPEVLSIEDYAARALDVERAWEAIRLVVEDAAG